MAAMIADLMFPRGCAGCDCPDAVLCVECRKLFHQHVERSLPGVVMDRWFACGWYRGSVRRAILSWKDHGDEECDGPLCEMLHDLARSCGLIDLLRGRVPYDGPILIIPAKACNALESRGVTRRSVQMQGVVQRSRRLKGHVAVRSGIDVRGVPVVLIDDIITSGTTMRRCVEVLQQAGATVVTVLALAYTPPGGSTQENDHSSSAV